MPEDINTLLEIDPSATGSGSPLAAQNERLLSLVRLCRSELHEQDAITDRENADLVQQSNLRVVLETHDDLRTALGELRAMADEMADALEHTYDATEWPADGTSRAEQTAKKYREKFSK